MVATDDLDHEATGSRGDAARILLDLYKENLGFVRHYEEIRFKFSQLTITLAAALVGLSKVTNLGRRHEILIALFIVLLGLSGVMLVLTYTDRADRHAAIARAFRQTISEMLMQSKNPTIEDIHQAAARRHRYRSRKTRFLHHIRARYFWIAMHSLVVSFGIAFLLER